MNITMNGEEAKIFVDGIYRQVAERWRQRVSGAQFMKVSSRGKTFKRNASGCFLKNCAAYTMRSTPWKLLRIINTSTFFVSIAI